MAIFTIYFCAAAVRVCVCVYKLRTLIYCCAIFASFFLMDGHFVSFFAHRARDQKNNYCFIGIQFNLRTTFTGREGR